MTASSPVGQTEPNLPDGNPVRMLVVNDEAILTDLLSMSK